MSLRIYIKGTPKFSSPKRTTQPLPFSPNFNTLYASKSSHPSKNGLYRPGDSKDPSVMHETHTLSMDNPSHSFDEHSASSQLIKRKATGQLTGRNLNNRTEDQHTDRFLKNEKEIRSQKEIQEAIREFTKKLNTRTNVPERQLRKIIKESDNMILSLLEEVEQLTEMLTEKYKDNELLKSFTTIPMSTQDYRGRPGTADDGRTDVEVSKRNESVLDNIDIGRLIQENKRLAEHTAELNEEVSLLREMASSSEQTLQKERESFLKLKTQAEALLDEIDEVTARSKEKDMRMQKLEEELLDAKVCAEKLRRAAVLNNDESKKSLLADLQSPQDCLGTLKMRDDMNNTLSPFSQGVSTTMWSQFKIESPLYLQQVGNKAKEDVKELQKKYEDSKNDNVKLMKMIEENQKVIKSLREAFSELEKRSTVRFEEIKGYYESRVEGALQESNVNVPRSGNNESLTKATSGASNSFLSSHGFHSKKPSYDARLKRDPGIIPMGI